MEDKKVMISSYKNTYDKTSKDIPLIKFIEGVRDGKWQDTVLTTRAKLEKLTDKTERNKIKQKNPLVRLSGSFSGQSDSDLIKHSGFIAIDIDNIENPNRVKDVIKNDPYVYAASTSISGHGLFVIFRIDGTRHADAFDALSSYLRDNYQLLSDPSCRNVSRARYVSYDPYIVINESALTFKKYLPKKKAVKVNRVVYVQTDLDRIVRDMYDRGVNICEDYRDWVSVGYAIAAEFGKGQQGLDYYQTLSSISSKYNEKDTATQYAACVRTLNPGKRKQSDISLIYHHAKYAGIELYSQETKEVVRAASSQFKNGVPKESIAHGLKKFNDIDESTSMPIIEQVIKNGIEYESDNIVDDIVSFIRPYQLRKNLITRNVERDGKVLDDTELNSIYLDCKATFDKATKDLVLSTIFSNRIDMYDPLREFFDRSPYTGNEYPNLQRLLKSIESDTDKYETWVTKWLVSCVASAYGDYSPLVLVLSGERQGTGKCLGINTPILMFDGSIKMVQDVVVGDRVMGDDGSARNVLSLGRGREKMYKVIQNKGYSYIVNKSHILSLKNRDTKEVVNVNIEDYVNGNVKRKGRLVGYRGEIINEVNSYLPVSPYTLGLWLGDGQSDLRTAFRVESMDSEIIDYLYKEADNTGHKISCYIQDESKSNSYAFVLKDRKHKSLKSHMKYKLNNLGLHNNKHIPSIYKLSSRKQRLELLAGLIDSDGSKSSNCNYEITQKRKVLADDICFLCRSLGYRAMMSEKTINGKVYYRISIGGKLNDIPVLLDRKRIVQNNFYDTSLTGIRVEELGEDDYYGFEIDGNHLFMLGDFTVTHNTHFFRYILPKELRYLFAESDMDNGKDDEILMTKKLIILDDEYGGKSKREEKKLKKITSKEWINVREPYGRVSVDLRRLCMFCGTSNDTQIISDPTGNRRILPVHILSIDRKLYNECIKEDLWSELCALYKSGYDYTVLDDDIKVLNESSDMFNTSTPEEELLSLKLRPCISEYDHIGEWMTATEVIKHLTLDTKYVFSNVRMGMVLNKFGYEKKRMKRNGTVITAYRVERIGDYNAQTPEDDPF